MNYTYADRRFWLSVPKGSDLHEDIARIEGRRWHRGVQGWNLPASLRVAAKLEELGIMPKQSARDYLQSITTLPDPDVVTRVGGRDLFRYQDVGVAWLDRHTHALLHDEQGLGKTLQAVAWAADHQLVIVCAPLAVVHQWEEQACAVSKTQPIVLARKAKLSGLREGWIITNYERLKNIEKPSVPYTLIVDEAAYVRNTKSQRSKLVLDWGARANRVLAITGTPVINRPLDLWAIFLLLGERRPEEFFFFADRYCGAYRTPYGWDFSGATHLDELSSEIRHFALRRTKAEVLPDLPPKLRTSISVESGDKALRALAAQVLEFAQLGYSLKTGDGFASLQELRIECACSKVDPCLDWLEQHWAGGGGKVVIFSAFKRPLEGLATGAQRPESGLFPMLTMHGDHSGAEREETLKRFRESTEPCALAMTYGVGGVGLNLQHADTAIMLDLPWTPAELEQAEDRIHRIGQANTVNIVTLLTGLPIESQMLAALERKQDVVEGVLTLSRGATTL